MTDTDCTRLPSHHTLLLFSSSLLSCLFCSSVASCCILSSSAPAVAPQHLQAGTAHVGSLLSIRLSKHIALAAASAAGGPHLGIGTSRLVLRFHAWKAGSLPHLSRCYMAQHEALSMSKLGMPVLTSAYGRNSNAVLCDATM
jgi:hypothetical protein